MSFESPAIVTPESKTPPEEPVGNHERAARLAHNNRSYETIKSELIEQNLLSSEIALTKSLYAKELESASWLTEGDWEMLAVMNAYDEPTVRHCIRTLELARRKLEECTLDGTSLFERITQEIGSVDAFYRACLFHDVGKCCVPHEILTNSLTDSDIAEKILKHMNMTDDDTILRKIEAARGITYNNEDHGNLAQFITSSRPIHYAPASIVLSHEEIASLTVRFPDTDFSTVTLMGLIYPHEQESEKVLRDAGYEVEASLAGGHHTGKNLIYKESTQFLSITVSFAEIQQLLSLADKHEALTSLNRPYRGKATSLGAMSELLEEVKRKPDINMTYVAVWVRSELKKLEKEIVLPLQEADQNLLPLLQAFVDETLKGR